jgi:hypothetical protein
VSPLANVAAILAARNLAAFNGLVEDAWFDAKGPVPYDLASHAGRIELAKDVSSFANTEGGYIVVGLMTVEVPEQQTEQVNGLALIPEAEFNVNAIAGIARHYLHPRVQGLEVRWVADAGDATLGVGVIYIPVQPPDNRFILMKQVMGEGSPLPQIVFGMAMRRGSNSVPLTVDDLYRMCQDGRSGVAERLTRIEAKIDSQIRTQNEAREVGWHADQMNERLQRILGNE